jgi:exodeoxyribonuclease VIII
MHIMIDLETLGVDVATAPIIQIGAAAFELHGDGPVDVEHFRIHVDPKSCLRQPFNREINPDTVAWWAETDPELLVEIMRSRSKDIATALAELALWFIRLDDGIEGVWSNGACFDIVMLEAYYKQAGIRAPWHFRSVRDVRTMAMIAGDHQPCWSAGTITDIERDGQKHDALVDCLRQIRMVQQTWQRRIRTEEIGAPVREVAGPLGQDAG